MSDKPLDGSEFLIKAPTRKSFILHVDEIILKDKMMEITVTIKNFVFYLKRFDEIILKDSSGEKVTFQKVENGKSE